MENIVALNQCVSERFKVNMCRKISIVFILICQTVYIIPIECITKKDNINVNSIIIVPKRNESHPDGKYVVASLGKV